MAKKEKTVSKVKPLSGYFYNSKPRQKIFLDAFRKSLGNIAVSCRAVGIQRQTYYNAIERNEEFAQQVLDIQEELLDYVESKLVERIKKGDTTATIFFCKTKGKERGYHQSDEVKFVGDKQNPVELNGNFNLTVIQKLVEEAAQKALDDY